MTDVKQELDSKGHVGELFVKWLVGLDIRLVGSHPAKAILSQIETRRMRR